MVNYDYLIIGQGLAGTTLAIQLIRSGKKVLVIDNDHHQSSSMVAAGMWNPIVFRKLNKSWRVDDLLPEMTSFYRWCENEFQANFLHFKDIARIYPGREQENDWIARSAEPGYSPYLADDCGVELLGIKLRFDKGFGIVKQSGYLNVAAFLTCSRKWLLEMDAVLSEPFDHSILNISEEQISYQNLIAQKIIFCEGFRGAQNPWFSKLPFGNTKGELITIQADGCPEELIPNLGVWMLPVGDKQYKVGATFEWQDMSTEPTEKARVKLINELEQLCVQPYEIIRQQAGIRPTTQDRRPMAGMHAEIPNVGIFNGLGTKGVMNAPWCATRFCEHLITGADLPADIDVNRFTY